MAFLVVLLEGPWEGLLGARLKVRWERFLEGALETRLGDTLESLSGALWRSLFRTRFSFSVVGVSFTKL